MRTMFIRLVRHRESRMVEENVGDIAAPATREAAGAIPGKIRCSSKNKP